MTDEPKPDELKALRVRLIRRNRPLSLLLIVISYVTIGMMVMAGMRIVQILWAEPEPVIKVVHYVCITRYGAEPECRLADEADLAAIPELSGNKAGVF